MPAPLTPFQARVALHLARAHHHLWASLHDVTDEQIIAWMTEGRLDLLEAACLEQGAGMPGGITPSVIDGADVIVAHRTGSGRLSWQIWPGSVLLAVKRPDVGRVLECFFVDEEDWEQRRPFWVTFDTWMGEDTEAADSPRYGRAVLPRHLEAVETALGYRCSDMRLLEHVRDSAGLELDRAREALRVAGEGLVTAMGELARFCVERKPGAS